MLFEDRKAKRKQCGRRRCKGSRYKKEPSVPLMSLSGTKCERISFRDTSKLMSIDSRKQAYYLRERDDSMNSQSPVALPIWIKSLFVLMYAGEQNFPGLFRRPLEPMGL